MHSYIHLYAFMRLYSARANLNALKCLYITIIMYSEGRSLSRGIYENDEFDRAELICYNWGKQNYNFVACSQLSLYQFMEVKI